VTFDLSAILAIATLLSLGVTAFVAWVRSTMRADLAILKQGLSDQLAASDKAATERLQAQSLTFASLRESVLDRIDAKLSDFVRNQTFKNYEEGHAKEHLRIETELTRLRDFKHDAEGMLRAHGAKLEGTSIE